MLNSLTRSPHKQQGASMIVILLFVTMAAFILLVAFKLYPVYFEHWQIQSVVQSFEDEPDLDTVSMQEMAKRFKIRLQTNNVREVSYQDAIEIFKEDGVVSIYVDYEVRVPIYSNIDAIVHFEESTDYTP